MSTNSSRAARRIAAALALTALTLSAVFACRAESARTAELAPAAPVGAPAATGSDLGTQAHLDLVMTSRSCAHCHPDIYAEHAQNTHGRAFFDGEARLATRGFRREDCVRCHTPRPVFETGIGMTPMQRWTDLEEGNTCMSCHWKSGYDYSRFEGGAECELAFDPRVGSVQACASCHRIAGTPDQWSRAEHGEKAGNVCLDCHMPLVERPVAVGEPPRAVRSHAFPASRSESQLRKAYAYEARIEGDHVVVLLANKGAGHNFPTATRQRAVESLVTVRDAQGEVIGTSRMVCRYPYASELAPAQMTMPVSTQIPSGKSREQRVPLPLAAGTVECELFFKLYRPIEDYHPTLSRRLEDVRLTFSGVEPSGEEIRDAPDVGFAAPQAALEDFFSAEGLVNVARPPPGGGPVELPEGQSAADIARLVSMLEFHMPEARKRAHERLLSIGPAAWPALVDALGSWSNETFNQAIELLASAGEPVLPEVRKALRDPRLYVRCHARAVIEKMRFPGDRRALGDDLASGLAMPDALDRRSAARVLGALGDATRAPALRGLLDDADWDVVSAAAQSLAELGDRASVPAIERALARATFVETRRDLALALCDLGSVAGIPPLLDGLAHPDDLTRASCFDAFFAVTGMHAAYDPYAPEGERLEALARLRTAWSAHGGPAMLRERRHIDPAERERAWDLVTKLGGGTDTEAGGDDTAIEGQLVHMGSDALPALVEGLTFPSGFTEKRARICQLLGRIGDAGAAPYLVQALRDPSLGVAEWACWALEGTRDAAVMPALARFEQRVLALEADPAQAGTGERLLARSARTRMMLGDARARDALVNLLLSPDLTAREIAIGALSARYGDDRGYDPNASAEERGSAVRNWRR
jgi:HEAT repeat protein